MYDNKHVFHDFCCSFYHKHCRELLLSSVHYCLSVPDSSSFHGYFFTLKHKTNYLYSQSHLHDYSLVWHVLLFNIIREK